MTVTVLDTETTVNLQREGRSPLPFFDNKLVLVVCLYEGKEYCLRFTDVSREQVKENAKIVQDILDDTTILVGHNLQFDLIWLEECGFKYEKEVWDTMIFEYVKHLGTIIMPSLEECCGEYDIPCKTLKLKDYFDKGINTDQIDPDLLAEYAINDIRITNQLFNKQIEQVHSNVRTWFRKSGLRK